MTGFFLPLAYLTMCLLVGLCAVGRRPGFLVTTLLALLLTPFLMLLLLFLTRPRGD